MLKLAMMIVTLLYGCLRWSLNKPGSDRLLQVHRSMILESLGWLKRKGDDHTLSFDNAFANSDSESIEAPTFSGTEAIIRGICGIWGRSVCCGG